MQECFCRYFWQTEWVMGNKHEGIGHLWTTDIYLDRVTKDCGVKASVLWYLTSQLWQPHQGKPDFLKSQVNLKLSGTDTGHLVWRGLDGNGIEWTEMKEIHYTKLLAISEAYKAALLPTSGIGDTSKCKRLQAHAHTHTHTHMHVRISLQINYPENSHISRCF